MVRDIPPRDTIVYDESGIRIVIEIRDDTGADHVIDTLSRSNALDIRLSDPKARQVPRATRRSITRVNHG